MAQAKKPTVDPAEVLEKGLYEAAESGDNSLEVSDTNFVGEDQVYRNAAEDVHKPAPFEREEEVAIAEAQKAAEEANRNTSFTGYSLDDRPAQERQTATDKQVEQQRLLRDAEVARAQADLGEDSGPKVPPAPTS